jgi:two-component system, chemotaxis family, chemotaxis protein CheY
LIEGRLMAQRILVVDDNRLTRELLKEILVAEGFEIAGEAIHGLEAVKMHHQLTPDLTIMDIVMPDMNGVEATKEILKADPSARIVICSVLGQESMVNDAIDAGAKEYVSKPFKHSDVSLAVKRALAVQT